MEHILDSDSPISTSVSANSDDFAFIDDGPLFAPSPSPHSPVLPTPAPPAMEVVIESAAPAVALGVILAPDDEALTQHGPLNMRWCLLPPGGVADSCAQRRWVATGASQCFSPIQTSIRSLQ